MRRDLEDEDCPDREFQSCVTEEVSAYGPSRVEMNGAKDEVRIWEKKVNKRPKLREPIKVFVYGQFHRLLQLELRPLRSLLAALKEKKWVSRKDSTQLPTDLHIFSEEARCIADSMVTQRL